MTISSKNAMTPGSAAADLGLGLGDQLSDQVASQLAERQKMKKLQGNQNQSPFNPMGLATAAQSLGLDPSIAR